MDCTVHGILQSRILERVAFPFSRGSSQPRDQTQVSHIAGGCFTSWATREAQVSSVTFWGVCLEEVGLGISFPHELGEEGAQEDLPSRDRWPEAWKQGRRLPCGHLGRRVRQAALWMWELGRCVCRIESKPKRLKCEQVRAGGERPEPGRGLAGQGKEFGSYSKRHRKLWGCLRIWVIWFSLYISSDSWRGLFQGM